MLNSIRHRDGSAVVYAPEHVRYADRDIWLAALSSDAASRAYHVEPCIHVTGGTRVHCAAVVESKAVWLIRASAASDPHARDRPGIVQSCPLRNIVGDVRTDLVDMSTVFGPSKTVKYLKRIVFSVALPDETLADVILVATEAHSFLARVITSALTSTRIRVLLGLQPPARERPPKVEIAERHVSRVLDAVRSAVPGLSLRGVSSSAAQAARARSGMVTMSEIVSDGPRDGRVASGSASTCVVDPGEYSRDVLATATAVARLAVRSMDGLTGLAVLHREYSSAVFASELPMQTISLLLTCADTFDAVVELMRNEAVRARKRYMYEGQAVLELQVVRLAVLRAGAALLHAAAFDSAGLDSRNVLANPIPFGLAVLTDVLIRGFAHGLTPDLYVDGEIEVEGSQLDGAVDGQEDEAVLRVRTLRPYKVVHEPAHGPSNDLFGTGDDDEEGANYLVGRGLGMSAVTGRSMTVGRPGSLSASRMRKDLSPNGGIDPLKQAADRIAAHQARVSAKKTLVGSGDVIGSVSARTPASGRQQQAPGASTGLAADVHGLSSPDPFNYTRYDVGQMDVPAAIAESYYVARRENWDAAQGKAKGRAEGLVKLKQAAEAKAKAEQLRRTDTEESAELEDEDGNPISVPEITFARPPSPDLLASRSAGRSARHLIVDHAVVPLLRESASHRHREEDIKSLAMTYGGTVASTHTSAGPTYSLITSPLSGIPTVLGGIGPRTPTGPRTPAAGKAFTVTAALAGMTHFSSRADAPMSPSTLTIPQGRSSYLRVAGWGKSSSLSPILAQLLTAGAEEAREYRDIAVSLLCEVDDIVATHSAQTSPDASLRGSYSVSRSSSTRLHNTALGVGMGHKEASMAAEIISFQSDLNDPVMQRYHYMTMQRHQPGAGIMGAGRRLLSTAAAQGSAFGGAAARGAQADAHDDSWWYGDQDAHGEDRGTDEVEMHGPALRRSISVTSARRLKCIADAFGMLPTIETVAFVTDLAHSVCAMLRVASAARRAWDFAVTAIAREDEEGEDEPGGARTTINGMGSPLASQSFASPVSFVPRDSVIAGSGSGITPLQSSRAPSALSMLQAGYLPKFGISSVSSLTSSLRAALRGGGGVSVGVVGRPVTPTQMPADSSYSVPGRGLPTSSVVGAAVHVGVLPAASASTQVQQNGLLSPSTRAQLTLHRTVPDGSSSFSLETRQRLRPTAAYPDAFTDDASAVLRQGEKAGVAVEAAAETASEQYRDHLFPVRLATFSRLLLTCLRDNSSVRKACLPSVRAALPDLLRLHTSEVHERASHGGGMLHAEGNARISTPGPGVGGVSAREGVFTAAEAAAAAGTGALHRILHTATEPLFAEAAANLRAMRLLLGS